MPAERRVERGVASRARRNPEAATVSKPAEIVRLTAAEVVTATAAA